MKILSRTILLTIVIQVALFAQETTIKLPTDDNTSSFNVTNSSDETQLKLNADAGFYIGGTYNTGVIPVTGAGARLMWYPKKAAFRAGYVDGAQWNDTNIGECSTAMGFSTEASGYYSTAMGYETIASGYYSTAMGYETTASGNYSISTGNFTTASAPLSIATGTGTTASGYRSTAMGFCTTAQARGSLVLGRYNIVTGSKIDWISSDPLFVCGNGSSTDSKSDALTLFKNGNMIIAGTLTQNSDIRLKEEIVPLKEALSSLQNITPIYYRFKNKDTHPADRQIGFSAQEIEKEFPELVSKDSQGYLSVDYGHMTAVLLKAIKEQQEIIEQLEKRISVLENREGE